jgi:hypothetical protein
MVQRRQIQEAVEVADVHMGSSILHWGRELGYHFLRFDSHESHMRDSCDGVGDRHWVFVRRVLAPRLLW